MASQIDPFHLAKSMCWSPLPCPAHCSKSSGREVLIKLWQKLVCKHILVASWHAWQFRRVKHKGSNSGLEELLGDGVLPWHHSSACDKLFQQHNNLLGHRSVCLHLVWRKQLSPKGEALSRPFMHFLGLNLVFKISKWLWFCTDLSKFYRAQQSYRGHLYLHNKSSTDAALVAVWRTLLWARVRVGSNPLAGFLVLKSKRTKGFQAIEARSHEKWVTYGLLIAVPALCKASYPSRELTGWTRLWLGGCTTPLG